MNLLPRVLAACFVVAFSAHDSSAGCFRYRTLSLSPQASEQLILARRLFFWRVVNLGVDVGTRFIPQAPGTNTPATSNPNTSGGSPGSETAPPAPPVAPTATLTATDFQRIHKLLKVKTADGKSKSLSKAVGEIHTKLGEIEAKIDAVNKKVDGTQSGLAALAGLLIEKKVISADDLKKK